MFLKPSEVLVVERGFIPVILTIPHATPQREAFGMDLQERHAEEGVKREELKLISLKTQIVERLSSIWGKPFVIVPKVHRSRVDFARSKVYVNGERAFDDLRAESLYDAFEQLVTETIKQATQDREMGLLIDLHGCFTDEQDLFIGTLNGETVNKHNGRTFGKDTLYEYLNLKGWHVSPEPGQSETRFAGRHDSIIARHNLAMREGCYGSIQLEISRAVRLHEHRRAQFGCDLAEAIFAIRQRDVQCST